MELGVNHKGRQDLGVLNFGQNRTNVWTGGRNPSKFQKAWSITERSTEFLRISLNISLHSLSILPGMTFNQIYWTSFGGWKLHQVFFLLLLYYLNEFLYIDMWMRRFRDFFIGFYCLFCWNLMAVSQEVFFMSNFLRGWKVLWGVEELGRAGSCREDFWKNFNFFQSFLT